MADPWCSSVKKLDNAIHRKNHYPLDSVATGQNKLRYSALDNDLVYPLFEQPAGPELLA